MRKHVQSLRNRSLSTQITQLTSRHFTPLLAAAELAHLRAPEARATLEGEGLGVRITASNDVVATYTVDEHDMQIAVSIPADFPLHGVEVKDVKRVGVTEAQWRAWLLATQQLLTGKNGLIYDGEHEHGQMPARMCSADAVRLLCSAAALQAQRRGQVCRLRGRRV